MKRLIQFLLALVMMIQGMQVAVAGASIAAGNFQSTTKMTPAQFRSLKKFFDTLQMTLPASTVGLVAKAQLRQSPTRLRTTHIVPLDSAGGLVKARWTTLPDAAETENGTKPGTPMILSSESAKLNRKLRAKLATTPVLTQQLFPDSSNGILSSVKSMRVTYQAGERLLLSGRVAAKVRTLSTIVLEETNRLSDGTLGPWYRTHTLTPDTKGRFSQEIIVKTGITAVRALLLVSKKNVQTSATTADIGMVSTPVPTGNMPFNNFGITTPPWQVANHQGFDNNGYYYASDYSGPSTSDPVDGTPIVWKGITFPIGPVPTSKNQVGGSEGPKNVVHAAGQTIKMPSGSFEWLYLAGAGANGNQVNQPITLNFTDGTTENWTQSFTDWTNNGNTDKPIPFAGESLIREQSYRINQLGNNVVASTYTYGYTHHLPKGKTLASLALPNNNNNLGILSAAVANEPPIDGDGAVVTSYVLGHTHLTGTDLVTQKITNQQSVPLTFQVANFPLDGCDPNTTTCSYATVNATVNQNQSKTVTYVAPSNWNNMGFTVQKANQVCVGPNCSTYLPDFSAGVNGTSCSTLNPTPGQTLAPGQTWTIYVQGQFTGYNGFLDGPGMPKSQNSSKYPNGCVFALNTAFQNWIANQPGWAKWLEGVVGAIAVIGISFLTFGVPESLAALFTATEEGGGAVIGELGPELVANGLVDETTETEVEQTVSQIAQQDAAVFQADKDTIWTLTERALFTNPARYTTYMVDGGSFIMFD